MQCIGLKKKKNVIKYTDNVTLSPIVYNSTQKMYMQKDNYSDQIDKI